MESNWAAEHLQVIRTLMERAAVYRRALAPVMIMNGVIGMAAGALGLGLKVATPRSFILFWACVAVLAVAGSFLLVRRQALKDTEPFWSPPTRRVAQALLPPLVGGFVLGAIVWGPIGFGAQAGNGPALLLLPVAWVVLYGCAFHAAGFFMRRGMKLFGWAFVLSGCGLFAAGVPEGIETAAYAHGVMGIFFGGLHLAYGVYLYFTEPRRNEA